MAGDSGPQAFGIGKIIREEVLGAAHVQTSLGGGVTFSRPMQELVTEYCWGRIWSRPGLSRQQRSLLNIGMLTALNRPHELEIHVGGALRNGCTPLEIQEALLQAAIYCGVPAALDAFRIAERVVEATVPAPNDAAGA